MTRNSLLNFPEFLYVISFYEAINEANSCTSFHKFLFRKMAASFRIPDRKANEQSENSGAN